MSTQFDSSPVLRTELGAGIGLAAALASTLAAALLAADGDAGAVVAEAGPEATEIDLGGRTVVPGFIDAHNHFACTAETFFAVDARPSSAGSIAELLVLIDHAAERTPPGGWVRGFGMDFT